MHSHFHTYTGKLNYPPNLRAFLSNSSIILEWDPPHSLVKVSRYNVQVIFNNTRDSIFTYQPVYVHQYNTTDCQVSVIEFIVSAHNPAGTGAFTNITVYIPCNKHNSYDYNITPIFDPTDTTVTQITTSSESTSIPAQPQLDTPKLGKKKKIKKKQPADYMVF